MLTNREKNSILFLVFYMAPHKTKGQIEDTIAKEIARSHMRNMGVGPRETRVYILEDMIIIRLKESLIPMEKRLLEKEGGIEMVKNLRQTIHELSIKDFGAAIERITGRKIVSSHSDISTKTGERLKVFILDANFETLIKQNLLLSEA